MDRLGLSEGELCRVLDADPLAIIAGELGHRPELPILLALTEEAGERAGPDVLRRWMRSSGPTGRPLEHLLRRDFAAFEDDVEALAERGFVVRGGGHGRRSASGRPSPPRTAPAPSRPATRP